MLKTLLFISSFFIFAVNSFSETVKIGMVLPLTGNQATYGVDAQRVVSLLAPKGYFEKSGFKFEFILEDGQCGVGNSATTAGHKLIHFEGVKFLVVGCSGEVLQIAPLAEKAKVVTVGYASSHPDIRNSGDYIFRTYVDITKAVQLIADRIKTDESGTIAVLTEESSFTLGIKKELLTQLGVKVAFAEDFHVDDTSFQMLLTKAGTSKASAYFLNTASPRTYQNLFKQLRQLGMTRQVYSYHMPSDPDVIKSLGAAQNGVKFVATPEVEHGSSEFETFFKSYITRYPDGPNIDFLLRSSYDAIMVLMESIMAVGSDTELVKQHLYNNTFEGALGKVSFDEYGDVRDVNFTLKEIVDGKPQKLLALH